MINVTVETNPKWDGPDQKILSLMVTHVLTSEHKRHGDISVILGSDEMLQNLKKKFFNKNHFTDVIAFRLNDYEEDHVDGEVYISLPRCGENADQFNEPFNKELGRLIIHGCLHLIGIEDMSKEEKKAMTKKEEYYLKQVEWNRLYG